MSAIRQNSSMSSPHVAFAVILAFSAILNGFGNKPPFGPDSANRWSGYVLSGSCRRSVKHEKETKKNVREIYNWRFLSLNHNIHFSPSLPISFPYAYNLINDLIYKSKWSNSVLNSLPFFTPRFMHSFNVLQLLNLSGIRSIFNIFRGSKKIFDDILLVTKRQSHSLTHSLVSTSMVKECSQKQEKLSK